MLRGLVQIEKKKKEKKEKEKKKKAYGFQISHFYRWFSSDILAVKGLNFCDILNKQHHL